MKNKSESSCSKGCLCDVCSGQSKGIKNEGLLKDLGQKATIALANTIGQDWVQTSVLSSPKPGAAAVAAGLGNLAVQMGALDAAKKAGRGAMHIARKVAPHIPAIGESRGSQEDYDALKWRYEQDKKLFDETPEKDSESRAHRSYIMNQSLARLKSHPLHPKNETSDPLPGSSQDLENKKTQQRSKANALATSTLSVMQEEITEHQITMHTIRGVMPALGIYMRRLQRHVSPIAKKAADTARNQLSKLNFMGAKDTLLKAKHHIADDELTGASPKKENANKAEDQLIPPHIFGLHAIKRHIDTALNHTDSQVRDNAKQAIEHIKKGDFISAVNPLAAAHERINSLKNKNLQETAMGDDFAVGDKIRLRNKTPIQGLHPDKVYTVHSHETMNSPAGPITTHVLKDEDGNEHRVHNASIIMHHHGIIGRAKDFKDNHPKLMRNLNRAMWASKLITMPLGVALEEEAEEQNRRSNMIKPGYGGIVHPFGERDETERLHNTKVNDLIAHAKSKDNYQDVKHYHTGGEFHTIIFHKDGTSSNPIITKRPANPFGLDMPRIPRGIRITNEELKTVEDVVDTLPLGVEKQGPGEKYGNEAKSAPAVKANPTTGIVPNKTGEGYKEMSNDKYSKLAEAAFGPLDANSPFRGASFNEDVGVVVRNPVSVKKGQGGEGVQIGLRSPIRASRDVRPDETVVQSSDRRKAEKAAAVAAKKAAKTPAPKVTAPESEKDEFSAMSHEELAHHTGLDPETVKNNREHIEKTVRLMSKAAPAENEVNESALKPYNPRQLFAKNPSPGVLGKVKDAAKFVRTVGGETLKQGLALNPTIKKALTKAGAMEENINNRNLHVERDIAEIMKESYKRKRMQEEAMNIYIASPEQREDWLNVGRGSMDVLDYINKYKV